MSKIMYCHQRVKVCPAEKDGVCTDKDMKCEHKKRFKRPPKVESHDLVMEIQFQKSGDIFGF
jgi:hypothetical protein